jgi:hypothetical protein
MWLLLFVDKRRNSSQPLVIRMRFVREQFYLAATAQNLKRLVRFLRGKPTPELATA